MAFAVLLQFGFSPEAMFAKAVEVHSKKDAIMGPGALIKDPVSAISVGMALMFGTAGLPHILMRFYTVPDARTARVSVAYATAAIGVFYLFTFILGFGAMVIVGQDAIRAIDAGGNMAAPLLAEFLGGTPLLGFIAAVAFATILAVVAGLTLAGAAAGYQIGKGHRQVIMRAQLALEQILRALECASVVQHVVLEARAEEAVGAALQAHAAIALGVAELAVVAQLVAEDAHVLAADLGVAARADLEVAYAFDDVGFDGGAVSGNIDCRRALPGLRRRRH